MKHSAQSQTIILWWSFISLLIFGFVFYALFRMVPPPSPSLTPVEVVAFYSAHAFDIKLGAVIASVTSAFLIPFSVVLGFQLARIEEGSPVWSVLAVIGGSLTCIFLVLPPILWGVAAFTTSRPPELTALVNEIANLSLITTGQFYIFSTVPIIYVGLKAKPDPYNPFPRWVCWLTAFLTIIGETGIVAFMFKTGPFAWDGLLAFFIPFGVYFFWIFALYYLMFSALKRQAKAGL